MKSARLRIAASVLALAWVQPAFAAPGDDADDKKDDIVITGTLPANVSGSATGLALTLRETPQSVTIIDRQRLDDFALNNVNDVLDQVVGINVERAETDRTQYNSRGFDITNFQVDGIGLPFISGIQFGDLDTILWDRVEAVRGANAIMTGVGNPSATINYVRKRPTENFRASASVLGGSWDQLRFEGDVSGPLDASGKVAARLIYAHDNRDTWLDYNHVNRNVYGAIISWKVTSRLTATAGYTEQDNHSDGVLWGALPLTYTDGTRIPLPVSATTSAPWTYWDVTDKTAFGELAYDFGGGWSAKGVFTYRKFHEMAKLLYAYNYPDRETGLGVGGMSGIYPSDYNSYLGDFYASGPFTLFGREHQLAFGVSSSRRDGKEWEAFSLDDIAYGTPDTWGKAVIPEPTYPEPYLAADYTDWLTRAYGAAHLNIADPLKIVVGASAIWLKISGNSYEVDQTRKNSKVSPYAGAVLDLSRHVSLYASYTNIYNPQSEDGSNGRRLDPADGTSIEGGIKSEWFGGRLYATAALFRARQQGLASQIGTVGDPDSPCLEGRVGTACYVGVDTIARGFEIELAGKITDNWSISGGYTGLEIKDQDGNPARIFSPRKSLKFATTYSVPQLNDLKVGAQLRWQGATRYADSNVQAFGIVSGDVTVKQNDYAVLDLMAGVRLADHVRATVNLRNVTNTKYLGGLMWGQAFYAQPRSAFFSIGLDF